MGFVGEFPDAVPGGRRLDIGTQRVALGGVGVGHVPEPFERAAIHQDGVP